MLKISAAKVRFIEAAVRTMWSVELNNYPHRGEDNDVRHDPGHHRCPVMDGSDNLIPGIIWDPGHLISVRRKPVVFAVND